MAADAIVTGGAGFIGSHVVDRLVADGAAVSVVDDLSGGRRENLASALDAGASLHEADIRDAAAMDALLSQGEPGVVYHLAAQVSVTRSVSDPQHDASVNVLGTAVLLEAARRAGVPRFVYVSTGGALYGDADERPTPETAPIAPESPYGQSKWAAEGYARLYERLHGLSTLTLRLGNVYGPRQDPHGEAGVVAIFCDLLRAGRRPTVFGDGLQTRDYVHVDDVVAAVLAAGASDERGAVNVSRGVESSVLDLVQGLQALEPAADFSPDHLAERPGESRHSCLDPSRAAQRLGWRAEVGLPDGLRATYESFRGP
jgi:UDP-glucose 4-epimerase